MKKLTTQITKNNKTKTIYAMVDDEIAKWLENVDPQVRHEYIVSEHEIYLSELRETRRHQSLDLSLENGHDFEDEDSNLEEQFIKEEMHQKLHKAILSLSKEQQWLVNEIFFKDRSNTDVANELGVTEGSIRHRLETIYKKIREFFI